MRFSVRKRRTAPAVIIVALIDVLVVLLIFLMVTTTFKQQPALRLALPESSQAQKTGASESAPLIVSAEVVLFSVMAVTFAPTPPLIVVRPVLEPRLVMVPVLLTLLVDRVIVLLAVALKVRLPAPVMPPLMVRLPPLGERVRS